MIKELKEKLRDNGENTNDQKSILIYKWILSTLRLKIVKMEIEIENISKENENLRVELDDLKHENKEEPKCLKGELGTNYSKEFPCKECEMDFKSLFLEV